MENYRINQLNKSMIQPKRMNSFKLDKWLVKLSPQKGRNPESDFHSSLKISESFENESPYKKTNSSALGMYKPVHFQTSDGIVARVSSYFVSILTLICIETKWYTNKNIS